MVLAGYVADRCFQCHLLAEPELTLKKALELAQTQEMAEQGVQHMQQQPQYKQIITLVSD